MNDEADVILVSDDDGEPSQPETKKRKCTAERSGRSDGAHVATEGDDVQNGKQLDSVNIDLETSEGLDAEFDLIPENDTPPFLCEAVKNLIDTISPQFCGVIELKVRVANEVKQKDRFEDREAMNTNVRKDQSQPIAYAANEEDVGNKFNDRDSSEDIEVWESDGSINVIEISSDNDGKSTNTNSSSDGEDIYSSQPLVDVAKEAENPDIEQKHVDEDISITISNLYETKPGEESNNIVVQRLLRGPRYFDPHEVNREVCRLCGEEDHKTSKCALKKRKKPCFICADPGHNGMHCKKGQECLTCNRLGHLAKQCPNKAEERYPTSNTCLRCGGSGHDMWTCNSDYPHEDLKEIQCYICKNFGHLCCVDNLDIGPKEISCCNCGESGHVGSECAKEVEITTLSTSSKSCKKCKKKGHTAHRCKKYHKAEKRAQRKAAMEGKDALVSKSTLHDLNKAQKRIKIPYKERASRYARKPLVFRGPGSNVWRAPSTIINNNENISAAALSSSQNFPHAQNPTQVINHFNTPPVSQAKFPDTFSLFVHGNFPNPQNYIEMSNHFNRPVTPSCSFPIPQNPYQTLNNLPFPGSQSYYILPQNQMCHTNPPGVQMRTQFPVPQNPVQMFNQHVFPPGTHAYRGTNYLIPQNHVQMFNHQVAPLGYQATLYRPWSPWSSTFSLDQRRNTNNES